MAGVVHAPLKKGVLVAVALASMTGWGASRAYAADAPVHLVHAPKSIAFGQRLAVRGRVSKELTKYLVALERRSEAGTWTPVGVGTPRRTGAVKVVARSLEENGLYRLSTRAPHHDGVSKSFRVRVQGEIVFDVTPVQVMAGDSVTISGSVMPEAASRLIVVKQTAGGRTRRLGKARIADGRFSVTAKPRAGAGFVSAAFGGGLGYAAVTEHKLLTVFKPAEATWYGPGFFGNGTACGQVYTPDIVGVAHRTLPCGTYVSVFFGGQVMTVPVIDRGPYSTADWDLSAALANALGFSGRQTVGSLKASTPGE